MPSAQMSEQIHESKSIGIATPRIDGALKTTGQAMYASDHHFKDLVYAWPTTATIASGSVRDIDTTVASGMPGVIAIYTHQNIGPLYRMAPGAGKIDEMRPPLEDKTISYYGQYVAVAVAMTLEQAHAAAEAVKVTYDRLAPHTDDKLLGSTLAAPTKTVSERGDIVAALASAGVKHDAVYSIAAETHNPIELHASVAVYEHGKFTLYETTQGVINHRDVMASMLGVPKEDVQVITRFLGSGFGGKAWPWPQAFLAAACARNLGRPVKLVVSRSMMFHSVGHRPALEQRIQLAADSAGKLTAIAQDYVNHTSMLENYNEACGEATGFLYSCPNLKVTGGMARRNVGPPTSMRGPGAVPGIFALESAMDELAWKLKIDPVQLRLLNEPEKDETNGMQFSSRNLEECLNIGAEKFGWARRNPAIGSMKNPEGATVGWGMAACSWLALRGAAEVGVEIRENGSARVTCGTQDIGTETYTIIAQLVSHETGIPVQNVEVVIGDSALPPGPLSGGSKATASVTPAALQAAQSATKALLEVAHALPDSPFKSAKIDDLQLVNGAVRLRDSASLSMTISAVLKQARLKSVSGQGKSDAVSDKKENLSFHSFGAQFIEVTWQPEIAQLRVSRVVSVMDVGRVVNPLTARNQIEGAIVMGVGMAMLEATEYDQRTGAPMNANLADYVMAVHADCPKIEVTFLDKPDYKLNAVGARGLGEIGLAGVAPAIASAVYHATGIRVRKLPIRIEDLLNVEHSTHSA